MAAFTQVFGDTDHFEDEEKKKKHLIAANHPIGHLSSNQPLSPTAIWSVGVFVFNPVPTGVHTATHKHTCTVERRFPGNLHCPHEHERSLNHALDPAHRPPLKSLGGFASGLSGEPVVRRGSKETSKIETRVSLSQLCEKKSRPLRIPHRSPKFQKKKISFGCFLDKRMPKQGTKTASHMCACSFRPFANIHNI